MSNKRLAINMIANITAFIVTMGINFILTPYLVNTVGTEAYGFVGLANNFVSYGQLITLALNSMAGRFITIKIHQNNNKAANKYFTSVVIANTALAIIMTIPSILIIVFIEKIINIPKGILVDVQLLWGFIFINFLLSMITSTFNVATFVTNRLDLSSVRNIEANILKVLILVGTFAFFKPAVWYIGLSTLVCGIFIGIYDIYYKKKLLPEINVNTKYFDFKAIKEIVSSGIWNVVTKLGQIFTDGLDLLITNVFIGAESMGVLSIAKTVPSAVSNLLMTISGVFSPQLTTYYAKGDIDRIVKELKKSMKISGFFTNIALAITIAFGYSFYYLWVPGQDTALIQTLSILTIYGVIVSGSINSLFGVYTITNKLKVNSLVILSNGLLNTLIVAILLKTTNLGMLAVAGVSTTTSVIRNLTFTPMYSAKCLGVSKKTFYPTIFRYLFSSTIVIMTFILVSSQINSMSWISLFMSASICGLIGCIINYFLLFDKNDKKYINQIIINKIRRK